MLNSILSKNLLARKIIQFFYSINKKENPSFRPILINSIPKSGTHLLYQIFNNNPRGIVDNLSFIASMPSLTQQVQETNILIKKINKIKKGELVRGHLFYNEQIAKALLEKDIINYFIYRDPRDIVISEANYLYDMNKWHRLHKYFKKFPKLEDRIMFSIMGNDFYKTKIDYPNIKNRFMMYFPWSNSKNTFSIRYEDLIGDKQVMEIKKIVQYLTKKANINFDEEILFKNAISNINPKKSHTFREGGKGKWEKYFDDDHSRCFKEVAGNLLIKIGYETDYEW